MAALWLAALAFADIRGDRVIVHNVRNAEYRTETDYTVRLEDRALDPAKLRSLEMFLVRWGSDPRFSVRIREGLPRMSLR